MQAVSRENTAGRMMGRLAHVRHKISAKEVMKVGRCLRQIPLQRRPLPRRHLSRECAAPLLEYGQLATRPWLSHGPRMPWRMLRGVSSCGEGGQLRLRERCPPSPAETGCTCWQIIGFTACSKPQTVLRTLRSNNERDLANAAVAALTPRGSEYFAR